MRYLTFRYWIICLSLLFLNCSFNQSAIVARTFVPPAGLRGTYRIIAVGLTGQASRIVLFPGTVGLSEGTGALENEALDDLWRHFRQTYGAPEGRSLMLMNVVRTQSLKSFFLFGRITVVVRADVIEFTTSS